MAGEFQGHVFIGTSLDGFIARPDGDIRWLTERGLEFSTTGYDEFMSGIDGLIVGRATYETVLAMEQYWYEGRRVFVVSTTMEAADEDDRGVSIHPTPHDAVAAFTRENRVNAYVDGGKLIQSFLRAGLISRIIISRAPVLIGEGAPLFGPLEEDIDLDHVETKTLGAGFVQSTYTVL